MGLERVEGEMIEIGDPTEESAAGPASPPRVVIEYRDRGVPWMLIPPLLVLSAVAAVLAYPRLAPSPLEVAAPVAAPAPRVVQAKVDPPDLLDEEPLLGPLPPAPDPAGPPSVAVRPPAEPPTGPVEGIVIPPPGPVEPVPPPVEVADAPFPRVPNLGFDPKAFEAARDPEPPVDKELAPTAGPEPRGDPIAPEPARADLPEVRDQPAEVDPELLPPDPKLARLRRLQRVAEAKQQAEDDRGQFHTELRAICLKSGVRSAREIDKLCQRYNTEVEASIKARAVRLLGKAGSYEGAGRAVRINLLRSLGYPETAVLGDLMDNQRLWESDTARNGVRSQEEAVYRAAILLLNYPPNRVATATRPVSRARPGSGGRIPPVAPEAAQ